MLPTPTTDADRHPVQTREILIQPSEVSAKMSNNRMHIVDVFAQEKYAGNQLAVFHNTESMSTEEMQQLTREMNYSESTFIRSPERRDGGYDVRIFDPAEELQFAGHPTLGTAYVLREFVCEDLPDKLTLNLGVGQIPVTVEHDESGNKCSIENGGRRRDYSVTA